MEKGIFAWFGFLDPIEVRLFQIAEAGFGHVALWWEDETWPKLVRRLDMVEMARENGLKVDSIHLPYRDINGIWKRGNQPIVKHYQEALREIAACGGKTCVLHVQDEWYKPQETRYGIRFFEGILRIAEQYGLRIALENTHHTEILEHLLHAFPVPHLGLCYDSSHDYYHTETKGALLGRLKERLLCLHLSDTDGVEDRHWIPGTGIVDFAVIQKTLSSVSFDGAQALEVCATVAQREEGPTFFLKEAHRAIGAATDLTDL